MKVTFKGNQYQRFKVHKRLDEFITALSDPNSENATLVFQARQQGKGTEKYKRTKKKCHAWYFNGIFRGDTRMASYVTGTGLLYLDFDNLDNINEFKSRLGGFPFVVAVWESVSGRGAGALVRIPVISSPYIEEKRRAEDLKRKFRAAYRAAAETIGIGFDPSAANFYQPCHQPYDDAPFYNPQATELTVEFVMEECRLEKSKDVTLLPTAARAGIDLDDLAGVDNRFTFCRDLEPGAEEVCSEGCLTYPNGKAMLRASFPNRVSTGRRAATTHIPMSVLMYLNKHKPLHEFIRLMAKIMNRTFDEPWQHVEMYHHLESWYSAVQDGTFKSGDYARKVYVRTVGAQAERGGRQRAGSAAFQRMRSARTNKAVVEAHEAKQSGECVISISSISRETGVSRTTVRKHLLESGLSVDGRSSAGKQKAARTIDSIKETITKKTDRIMKLKKLNQSSIAGETGISRKTVNKYWNLLKPYVELCVEEKLLPLKVELNGIKYRLNRIENRAVMQHAVNSESYEDLFGEGSEYQRSKKELTELLDQL